MSVSKLKVKRNIWTKIRVKEPYHQPGVGVGIVIGQVADIILVGKLH